MQRLHLIVALARNGVIGRAGALPWRLPEDLAHFKRTTLGHCVIMGRRTWEAIGRPLPGRRNLVLTRDPAWRAAGAEPMTDLDTALRAVGAGEGFIIGGAQIYAQALQRPIASIYATEIDAEFAGDAFFPPLERARWQERSRTHFPAGPQRPLGFDLVRYVARA